MSAQPRTIRSGASGVAPYVAITALGSTAYIAAFTAAALAAREITGRAELSGLPSALGTVGTAAAIALLSSIMARRGRRTGLVAGWTVAVAGAGASVAAIAVGSFPLLLVGAVAVGFGNGAIQLSRYAAGDQLAPERRAAALGTVVWGSTAGAVLGPNLVAPAGAIATGLGRAPLEGGMAVTAIGFVLALGLTAAWVRRDGATAVGDGADAGEPGDPAADRADAAAEPELDATGLVAVDIDPSPVVAGAPGKLDRRLAAIAPLRVRVALVGLVAGQVVMVLIMTMTPVHIRDMGEPLATVGFVISAHTLGMFALSPLSGRLVGRFGAIPVLFAGFGTLLAAAALAAVARDADIAALTLSLFLLGYGWNLGFVAGSSLLTGGASLAERIRLQGITDVLVWTSGAVASVSSGLLLDLAGYQTLAVVGGVILVLPAAVILAARRRIPATMRVGA